MHFVKLFRDAINTVEKKKIEKLQQQQQRFLKNIRTMSNYDILELDQAFKGFTLP